MDDLSPFIITGPTAGGKSDFAEDLCDTLGGVIINADSLQVYKGLRQLTAQPILQEDHHLLYSIFEPDDKCDVVRWVKLVETEILTCAQRGKRPIIVGGTGLYLKVLMEGIAPIPPIHDSVVEEAAVLLQRYGLNYFIQDLMKKDPSLPPHLKLKDTQRILRAWTVLEGTGKPLHYWYQRQKPTTHNFIKILCLHERDKLYERINQRFDAMWKNGIVTEVQEFNATYQHMKEHYATRAIGFEEINGYLQGSMTAMQAIEKAKNKTRQYAKRQLTWFRHQFKADVLLEGICNNIGTVVNFCQKLDQK